MSTFHLSPQGNDQWSGRLMRPARNHRDGPWATLAGARDNLRALRTAGKISGPVTVVIQDGRYALSETVQFNHTDSHTRYLAAPGAAPVFDGGELLTGWKVGERNGRTEWTLDLPDVVKGKR
ncbi:MAG: hypothetical protein KA257_11930, partial [Opitutaceae bacterium]|nr:hypothetical protein [Opitutaceae bacterium]